jgi:hypothetical protein
MLPAAIRAMLISPESSASTLQQKRGKDSAAAAPSDAASEASGMERDWRYIQRKDIGSKVKNTCIPVKKHGHAATVLCSRIVMLCCLYIDVACLSQTALSPQHTLEVVLAMRAHRGREGGASQQKLGPERT